MQNVELACIPHSLFSGRFADIEFIGGKLAAKQGRIEYVEPHHDIDIVRKSRFTLSTARNRADNGVLDLQPLENLNGEL